MLRMMLQQKAALRCQLCQSTINSEDQADDMASALFFGFSDPYVFCPSCHQETGPIRQNPEYRRKARVLIYERYGVVLKVT